MKEAKEYNGLFDLMEQEHGLMLTISEMDDIINEVHKIKYEKPKQYTEEEWKEVGKLMLKYC